MKTIKQLQQRNKGFTLVELLFAIAIMGFMLTITLSTFIGVFRFYNWSKTTRTSQQAARDTLDTITREIRTGKISTSYAMTPTSLCINRTDGFISPGGLPVKSEKIELNSGQFQLGYYSTIDCPSNSFETVNISSPNVEFANIPGTPPASDDPVFKIVKGPFISGAATTQSVVVTFIVTTGNPDTITRKCIIGDNFCDQATFKTAVMER